MRIKLRNVFYEPSSSTFIRHPLRRTLVLSVPMATLNNSISYKKIAASINQLKFRMQGHCPKKILYRFNRWRLSQRIFRY